MTPETKTNLLNVETYKRLAFMVIFVIIFAIVELVVYAVAIAQFFVLLFTGTYHAELKAVAKSVSLYLFDIVKFITFDSEHLPFPFEPWSYSEVKEEVKEEEKTD